MQLGQLGDETWRCRGRSSSARARGADLYWAREAWSRLAPREDSWVVGARAGAWSTIPGRVFERGLAGDVQGTGRHREGRRQRGVFYTPVDGRRAGGRRVRSTWGSADVPEICDPAVGAAPAAAAATLVDLMARPLEEAVGLARWQAMTGPRFRDHLFGADLDPVAVEVCAQSLWLLAGAPAIAGTGEGPRIVTADAMGPCEGTEAPYTDDALRQRWGQLFHDDGGDGRTDVVAPVTFDRVVLNPPYVDAESLTRHSPGREIARRFSTARELGSLRTLRRVCLGHAGGQLHAAPDHMRRRTPPSCICDCSGRRWWG